MLEHAVKPIIAVSIFYSHVLAAEIVFTAPDMMGKICEGNTQSGAKNVPHGGPIRRERREKLLRHIVEDIPIRAKAFAKILGIIPKHL